jgi:hypothetical protein
MSSIAAALDARILSVIDAYALDDDAFLALARELLAYQLSENIPYAAFARALGFTAARLPERIVDIPAVPAAAFKEARLATFPLEQVDVWFETSGTTQGGRSGRHEMETTELYDAALLASFDRMMLADGARCRYVMMVPDPRARPHSSLGYMMAMVARGRGDGRDGWFFHNDELDVDGIISVVERAHADGVPVCVATTAFALVALLDELAARGRTLPLPAGSRVMETGGFKGRTRVVERAELYAAAAAAFAIGVDAIVAEYGMTELTSQYYDAPGVGRARIEPRVKIAPPWLRPVIVDGEGRALADGVVGSVRHIDLANRGSVIAVDTEDLGAIVGGGLVLIGREQGAELRGCSLDAETLLARR